MAAARTHLTARDDVVMPQLIARQEFIAGLDALAVECGARFREVFLLPDEGAASRYRDRAHALAASTRPDPAISADCSEAELARSCQLLLDALAARPAAVVILTYPGEIDALTGT